MWDLPVKPRRAFETGRKVANNLAVGNFRPGPRAFPAPARPRTCTPNGNVANVAPTLTTLTRGTMRPGTTYLVVGLAALAAACASQSDTIPPTYVSPSTYENLTCRQLGEEVKRVTRAEAASTQTGKPADAADVGLFKGTMEALEQVSIEKGCDIQFQHG
jgi:hypothetical protein